MKTTQELFNSVCKIKRCEAPARFNFQTIGHPNGDAAASYCGEHINNRGGIWQDSPVPYSVILSGPFGVKP